MLSQSLFSVESSLHLQEPRWLFLLIPLALILWLISRSRSNTSAWSNVIDKNLLPYLLQGKESKVSALPQWLLAIGGILAILALADPVWEKIPRPVFQTNSARVIVLDLSNSMLIDDLKPSRLARARFKIEDILSSTGEGQTGLVVFAGDAFTASPLTRDVDTIRNLLQVFTPRLMPSQGSRVDYGLKKAHELLKQANIQNGEVLLIADGVSNPDAAYKEAQALRNHGHTVSVLAVGTKTGGFLRLRTKRVNIKLDADSLQKISKKGGGGYHTITSNNTDLNTVLKDSIDATKHNDDQQNQMKSEDFKSDDWKSTGPYLLLLLLPLAALAFRKGWLLNIFFVIGLVGVFTQIQPTYAEGAEKNTDVTETNKDTEGSNTSLSASLQKQWQKLWLNAEQRADNAIKQKQFKQASQLSQEPMRKGSAAYKNNAYKSALGTFQKAQGADARYNEGNTQAKLKKYKEAIESYKKALQLDPNMEDAKANKKALEDFLKKQKKKNKKDSKQDDKNKDQKNKDNKDKKNKDQKKGDKNQKQQNKNSDNKDQEKKDSDKSADKENQFDKANKDLDKDKNSDKQDKEGQESDPNKNPDNSDKKEANKDKKSKTDQKKTEKESKEEAEKAAKIKADKLSKEEKMAAEQWLRRIPDDPGGLLRRKFRRQYQRSNRRPNDDEQPW